MFVLHSRSIGWSTTGVRGGKKEERKVRQRTPAQTVQADLTLIRQDKDDVDQSEFAKVERRALRRCPDRRCRRSKQTGKAFAYE